MPKVNPRLVLVLGVLGVSLSSIFVRFSRAPSLVTATGRMLWAVVLLTPVVLLRAGGELRATKGRDIARCAASGLLLALHFATWFESLKRTSVASSTALVATEVIFASLGFALFFGGRVPRAGVAGIVATLAGSLLIGLSAGDGAKSSLSGNLLALLAAVFVAGYTLIGRAQRARMSTLVYTWFTYLSSALVLLVLDAFAGTPLLSWGRREVLICLALALLCTLMGHSLFSWCLKYLSPAYVSAMKLCEPVFASLLAVLLFGEFPVPVQLAGAALVVGGVLLYTLADTNAAPPKEDTEKM